MSADSSQSNDTMLSDPAGGPVMEAPIRVEDVLARVLQQQAQILDFIANNNYQHEENVRQIVANSTPKPQKLWLGKLSNFDGKYENIEPLMSRVNFYVWIFAIPLFSSLLLYRAGIWLAR